MMMIGEYHGVALYRMDESDRSGYLIAEPGVAVPPGAGSSDRWVQMDRFEAGWLMATLEADLHIERNAPPPPLSRSRAADELADEMDSLAGAVRWAAGAEAHGMEKDPDWWEGVAARFLRLAAGAHRLSSW